MITYEIKAGTTDVSVVCRAVDSADGTPETGFDHATAGIDLKYRREGAVNVDITEAALAALTTAHTDGGVEQIGNGYFRLDLPDAACASGVPGVLVHGTATGMVIIGCYIRIVANTAEDVFTRIGAPAGASVSADIAAIEGQTDDIGAAGAGLTAVPWNAAWDAEVQSEVADALAAYDPPTNAELVSEINSVQSDIASLDTKIGTPAGASVSADIAAIEAQTDDIGAAGAGLTAVPWVAPASDGAHPTLGIIDQGTAQSASATGIVLRSAAAFADNTLRGATLFAFGSTQGYWQSRVITANALSGDTVTVDTWTVTPSGTITYKIFGSPPGSTTAPMPANIVQVIGDPVQESGATDTNWGGAT